MNYDPQVEAFLSSVDGIDPRNGMETNIIFTPKICYYQHFMRKTKKLLHRQSNM